MNYFNLSAQELGRGAKIPTVKPGDSGEVFYDWFINHPDAVVYTNAVAAARPF